MKILIVSQFYYPEKFTISDIASQLVKFGHEVTVVTGKPNYGFNGIPKEYKKRKFEIINGVNVYRVKLFPRKKSRISIIRNYLSFHRNAKSFVRHLDEEFDVVLSVSLSPVISIAPAILYAKKHNVPHVLYCLDLWPESTVATGAVREGSLLYKFLYQWSKNLYKRCDRILISSPSFETYFHDVLKINNKTINFVPQPALIHDSNKEAITYKAKHNFVYAGNIGSMQRVDLLVKAMSLFKANDDVILHLIGMGSDSIFIDKLVHDYHLENKVIIYGPKPVDETIRYYYNADALIVSLASRGFVGKTIPNKLTQYLYFSRPILGVIDGDGKDVIDNAGGGFIAMENVQDVFDKMNKIIHLSEAQKKKLGLSNREYYDSNFTLEHVSRLIEFQLKESMK